MTVETKTSKATYSGNNATTVFDAPFVFLDKDDLVVTLVDGSGVESNQSISTHYSVAGIGDPNGGNVTMMTPPLDGETLVIRRVVSLTQPSDLEEGTKFPTSTVETMADRNTMMAQQLSEESARMLKAPVAENAVGALPTATERANRGLGFDANGDPTAVNLTLPGDVVVTTAAADVLDDPTVADMRTTLGLAIGSDVQAFDADTLKADQTDCLEAGFTVNVTEHGNFSSTFAPTLNNSNTMLQNGTVVGNMTIEPLDVNGVCEVVFNVDGTGGHTITFANLTELSGIFVPTANAINNVRFTTINGRKTVEIANA